MSPGDSTLYAADIISGNSGDCVTLNKNRDTESSVSIFVARAEPLTLRRLHSSLTPDPSPNGRGGECVESLLARNQDGFANRKHQTFVLDARVEKCARFGRRVLQ